MNLNLATLLTNLRDETMRTLAATQDAAVHLCDVDGRDIVAVGIGVVFVADATSAAVWRQEATWWSWKEPSIGNVLVLGTCGADKAREMGCPAGLLSVEAVPA